MTVEMSSSLPALLLGMGGAVAIGLGVFWLLVLIHYLTRKARA